MPNWKKVIVSGSEAHLTSVTSSKGVNLADDAFLNLGDGNDLQLYHDGDNSYIKDAGTGGLFYRGGTQTFQNAAGSKTMAVLNAANSVDLNFNNNTKFQTTNTGVSVTGEVVATANVSSSATSTGSFGAYGNNFIPVGDNALDLGSSGNEWKDLYVDGIAYLDSINMPHEGKIDFAGGDGIIEANGNNNQIYLERNASGGHVGIYTTNPQSTLEVNGSFHASGNISGSTVTTGSFGRVETDGDISGSVIRASGDIIAFNSSDERLKDNVTYIHKPIEKINQIGGYEFDWNEKQQVYHGHDVGVLAQELEKVLPEAVKDRDSGYKGVQYDKIIPLLIEGIKELTKKTKKLEKEIKKLKHKK